MAIIYEYFQRERMGFFKDPKFRFSNPADLNDPMDCIPALDLVDVDKRVQDVVHRNREAIRSALGEIEDKVIQKIANEYKQKLLANKEAFLNVEGHDIPHGRAKLIPHPLVNG